MRTSPTTICKGFTLLELMVVICLLSLLAAVIFPSLPGVDAGSLKTDSRRIASILRYLNDSAISTKDEYFLTIDFKEDTVSWKGPDIYKTETFKSLSSVELPSKGIVREGDLTITFGPLGAQENVIVHLKLKDEAMDVVLNQLSGRATILKAEG